LNFSINFYDQSGKPSCYKNTPDVQLPGMAKIMSGYINITKQLNATGIPQKTRLLITIRKNDFLINYLCKDGKSGNIIIEDRDCNLDFCEKNEGICRLFEIPGVHQLDEIIRYSNYNTTLPLPRPKNGYTDAILRGQWKGEVKITINDEIVAHAKFPSDHSWMWVEE
jgi:hypothetical protein